MLVFEPGEVMEIVQDTGGYVEAIVNYPNGEFNKAIGYKLLVGGIKPGVMVLCNRTAVSLGLGTGGIDFILANLAEPSFYRQAKGHIMKLRYTPLQFGVNTVEEQGSAFHHVFNEEMSLLGFPVVVGSLHSMLAPAVMGIYSSNRKLKCAYIMSDGGCLPLCFSKTAAKLKASGLIAATITYGHAFGGDYEAVNIFSALLAAKYCLDVDLAIVAMGPGIVGTGTLWGHTGIEQGEIANAVTALAGIPVIVPRLTFGDHRDRHYGISHHTLTVLERVCNAQATVVLPILSDEKHQVVMAKLNDKKLLDKHNFVTRDGKPALNLAEELQLHLTTMGRGIDQENQYFEAAAAAGIFAAELVNL
ncbi:MAG: DUF3866 family protein [Clostridia bacterium]|jgi:hypothetical protein|nr:DUF3866 family protein [Clostridia bacterium]